MDGYFDATAGEYNPRRVSVRAWVVGAQPATVASTSKSTRRLRMGEALLAWIGSGFSSGEFQWAKCQEQQGRAHRGAISTSSVAKFCGQGGQAPGQQLVTRKRPGGQQCMALEHSKRPHP